MSNFEYLTKKSTTKKFTLNNSKCKFIKNKYTIAKKIFTHHTCKRSAALKTVAGGRASTLKERVRAKSHNTPPPSQVSVCSHGDL